MPSGVAVDVSARVMNDGDISIALMISVTASLNVPVCVSVARFVYSAVNLLTSAVVSGRRNAFCPNAVTNWLMQVALSVVQGSTFALAVALLSTCGASESAAALNPSQAR